jgi:predicted Zn-dependent protease
VVRPAGWPSRASALADQRRRSPCARAASWRAATSRAPSRPIGAVAANADAVPLATLRGEIAIAKHDLPGATKLLDAALAKRPDDLDALLARAAVDLENNDPHAAQTRLEARYSKQAPPRLTIAYASALRLQKQWQDARVALGRITTDGAPGPITGRACSSGRRARRRQRQGARRLRSRPGERACSRDAPRRPRCWRSTTATRWAAATRSRS